MKGNHAQGAMQRTFSQGEKNCPTRQRNDYLPAEFARALQSLFVPLHCCLNRTAGPVLWTSTHVPLPLILTEK